MKTCAFCERPLPPRQQHNPNAKFCGQKCYGRSRLYDRTTLKMDIARHLVNNTEYRWNDSYAAIAEKYGVTERMVAEMAAASDPLSVAMEHIKLS